MKVRRRRRYRPILIPNREMKKLMEMREEAGLTRYAVGKLARLDDRYLARLESGEADNPGRDVLLRLCLALVRYTSLFNRSDVDEVFKRAGFPPSPDHLWDGKRLAHSPDRGVDGGSSW